MKFSCESCGAQYMISDEKVGPDGVRVRCKKCGNVVSVKRAPTVAPEIEATPPPTPEPHAEGDHENTLERELGDAFESVFGGGSPGLAAAAAEAAEGAGDASAPQESSARSAQDGVGGAEGVSDWYVAVADNQVGPLPAPGVKARWESGEIGPDTLAWRPGMADWVPLSTIAEMAQYLSPYPFGGARPAARPAAAAAPEPRADTSKPAPTAPPEPAVAPPNGASNGVANGALNGRDTSWKPSAASALAALASEEIASLQRPEARKPDLAAEAKGGSLLDRMDLPDGGIDPTNVLPLSFKGLDPTGEAPLKAKPAPAAPRMAEPRQVRKAGTRSVIAIGIAAAVLLTGGIGVVVFLLRPAREVPETPVTQAPAPAATVAVAPTSPPQAVDPGPSARGPTAPQGTAAAALPSATPSTGSPTAPPTVAATPAAPSQPAPAASSTREPARAAPPPEREPPPAVASRPHRRANPEQPPARSSKKSAQRLATAEPPPAEPPRKKAGGDPLLDVGGDDDIEKELGGKGSKRSVYVPPAIGGDLPDSVSVSQINEAVVGQKSGLVRCIDQQKAADRDTRGTLKVRWIISGDGSVRDVRLVSDEFARQPIARCITAVVKGIRFPRSRTSGQEVVFPFKF
jgi:predicted Zn finger-like uncharacterized protein